MSQIEHLKPRLNKIKEILEKPGTEFLLFFLGFIPSTLLVTYYSIESFQKAIDGILHHETSKFLNDHVILITVLALFLSYLSSNIHRIVNKFSDRDSPDSEVLVALSNGFNSIVDAKMKRFNFEYKSINSGDKRPNEIFSAITQPDQQIILLTELIHTFFQATDTKIHFKVRVIDIDENNKAKEWFYFSPRNQPPKTEISVLRMQDSSVSNCLKRKGLIIIEDINKEALKPKGKRKFVTSKSDDEIGSLLCFPVYHESTRCYPYVITVSANMPYFRTKRKDYYNWLFDQFACRMQLEHTLILLKKGVKNEKESGE